MRVVAESYFNKEVLHKSSRITRLGNVQGDILLALVVVWVAVYFCIARGVGSTEKVVWLTVPLPCVLMFVLLLRCITLDG
jgi:SNF family Na+-dependent transporter